MANLFDILETVLITADNFFVENKIGKELKAGLHQFLIII